MNAVTQRLEGMVQDSTALSPFESRLLMLGFPIADKQDVEQVMSEGIWEHYSYSKSHACIRHVVNTISFINFFHYVTGGRFLLTSILSFLSGVVMVSGVYFHNTPIIAFVLFLAILAPRFSFGPIGRKWYFSKPDADGLRMWPFYQVPQRLHSRISALDAKGIRWAVATLEEDPLLFAFDSKWPWAEKVCVGGWDTPNEHINKM